jgi:predicted DsbA family dithiol-disulfide isomerase
MKDKPVPVKIEMFYTLTCPNCKPFKRMITEVLPEFGDKFKFKTTLANAPLGMIRSMKLGIHTVPTVLIDDVIVFRELPARQELINKLNMY